MSRSDFEDSMDRIKSRVPSKGKMVLGVVLIAILITFLMSLGAIIEEVDKNDILVVKAPITGTLSVYTEPGWYPQWFGEVTHFKKSYQFWFSSKSDQGGKENGSIRARFNDNGHGNISGSVRIYTPLEKKKIIELYSTYNSQAGVEHELIRTVYEKAVYFAGPLMSSTESATSKKNLLISYIEDQAQSGVYKTTTRDVKEKDPITSVEKTVTKVELVPDPKAPNGIARAEISPLQTYGFKTSNLSINEVAYDKEVENQIRTQQNSIMAVQIAIANAKKAEQDAITAAKNGEAEAAKAKWAQEVEKATEVTKAEKRRDIAKLDKEAAEYTKQKEILLGQGEGERKRLVMAADGALTQKLATYENVMGRFAQELSKQKWVPEIVMGGGSTNGGDQLFHMTNLLSMQALKSLGLDISIPTGKAATTNVKQQK